MMTSIEFAKAVTESNLKRGMDRNFSSLELSTFSTQTQPSARRLGSMQFHVLKEQGTHPCKQSLTQNVTLCCRRLKVMLDGMQSQRLR